MMYENMEIILKEEETSEAQTQQNMQFGAVADIYMANKYN